MLIGLIGALLATALTGAIAGGLVGASRGFFRSGLDPMGMFGEALATGGVMAYLATRQILGSPPTLAVWLALFLAIHLLMYRARRVLAARRDWRL